MSSTAAPPSSPAGNPRRDSTGLPVSNAPAWLSQSTDNSRPLHDPLRCPLVAQLLRPPLVVPAYVWDVFVANFPDPAQWLVLTLETAQSQPLCPAPIPERTRP